MDLGLSTFGDIHPDPRTGQRVSPGQRIREVLERIRLADEVGLDYAGTGEHHRPEYAITSPSTVIAAALAQTSRITVGSAVTVLSTEDPVRVYQQFATMDQLSGGRVELLAGRGFPTPTRMSFEATAARVAARRRAPRHRVKPLVDAALGGGARAGE